MESDLHLKLVFSKYFLFAFLLFTSYTALSQRHVSVVSNPVTIIVKRPKISLNVNDTVRIYNDEYNISTFIFSQKSLLPLKYSVTMNDSVFFNRISIDSLTEINEYINLTKDTSLVEVIASNKIGETYRKFTVIHMKKVKEDIDKVPPIINIFTNYVEPTYDKNITILGKVDDNIENSNAKIFIHGDNIKTEQPFGFFKFVLPLNIGENMFTLIAIDDNNNKTEKKIEIIRLEIQNNNVIIHINDIQDTIHQNKVFVSGRVETKGKVYIVNINGVGAYLNNNEFNKELELSEGENNINIQVAASDGFDEKTISIYHKPLWTRKDYALFFAVKDYQDDGWVDLNNPINDAEAVANDLENIFGFETSINKNQSAEQIYTVLRTYQQKEFNENDQLFIFFSGHGIIKGSQGFFIPADGKYDDFTSRSYISYADLKAVISDIPCNHILLVIDACYSSSLFKEFIVQRDGKIKPKNPNNTSSVQSQINIYLEYKSRLGITAGINSISDGEQHSNLTLNFLSIFSKYLNSNQNTKILTYDEIKAYFEKNGSKPEDFGTFGTHEPKGNFLFIVK